MPWIRTPAGTLVPDDFMAEVQLLYNIAGAIEDCDLSDEEQGLMEAEMLRLEEDLDKEYINECDDSWDDRTDVMEMFDDEHEIMKAGQTQGTDGLPDDGKNEEKMMDEDEKAGERATQLKVEVELDADEQETYVEVVNVVEVEFENGVGAGERTRGVRTCGLSQELVAAESPDNGCGGSVESDEVGSGDWRQESVVIDIGAAATVWGGELGVDADENSIAYELAAGSLENGSDNDSDLVLGVGFSSGVSGLWRHISSECGDDFDADAVGNVIAAELDAAGFGSVMVSELGFGYVVSKVWKTVVGLEPLTLAARLLIKAGAKTGCGGLIDSCVEDFAYGSLAGGGTEDLQVSFSSEHEKMITFDDSAEGAQKESVPEIGCSFVVAELFRVVGYGLLDQPRSVSRNVLYDPGGSPCYVLFLNLFGLSSWGLLVSSVFASLSSAVHCCCCCLESPLSVRDSSLRVFEG